jgi:hypothetical protein
MQMKSGSPESLLQRPSSHPVIYFYGLRLMRFMLRSRINPARNS